MTWHSSWHRWLRRLWFAARTLATRGRFLTGKASFVEADIRMTTNSVSQVFDESGRPAGERLLAHYELSTRKPRTGLQGWRLFAERVGLPGPHLSARLECGYCGHHFIIQVLSAIDPLASDVTGGRPPGRPASYSAEWFRFMHATFEGRPSLYCPRCEQSGTPRVKFLN